ncbi:MAG: hypothetical protein JOZ47_14155 [Kutzneria sp.]|nr:hypothetical protein [Kutzneria sp.]
MSWHDFHRRREVIDAVLAQADPDPTGTTPIDTLLDRVPGGREVFADGARLLLALHHKWIQLLVGRIGLALCTVDTLPDGNRVEAVAAAWRRTAREHESLRRLLDANAGDISPVASTASERRLLAVSAGLAELDEPTEVIDRIGLAFLTLLGSTAPELADRRDGEPAHRSR